VRAIRRTWQVGRAFLKIDTGAGEQSNAARSIAGFPIQPCKLISKRKHGGRASTRPPSNILRHEIPSAAGGSWDRVACCSPDKPDSDPRPCLDDHSSPPLRTSSHSCMGRGTCGAEALLSFRSCAAVSRLFDSCVRLLLALIRLQGLLTQPQRLGSDLDEFIVGDEFNGLLQV
jgi:hypothetical protein